MKAQKEGGVWVPKHVEKVRARQSPRTVVWKNCKGVPLQGAGENLTYPRTDIWAWKAV